MIHPEKIRDCSPETATVANVNGEGAPDVRFLDVKKNFLKKNGMKFVLSFPSSVLQPPKSFFKSRTSRTLGKKVASNQKKKFFFRIVQG